MLHIEPIGMGWYGIFDADGRQILGPFYPVMAQEIADAYNRL